MNRMNDSNLEKRATWKRLGTLLCSIGTVVSYGYLIGGTGGYLMGRGRPLVAAAGLIGGTLLAWAAIKLWRSYLTDVSELNERDKKREETLRKS